MLDLHQGVLLRLGGLNGEVQGDRTGVAQGLGSGGDAADDDGGGANFNVVDILHRVILTGSQGLALCGDGDGRLDGFAGVGKLGAADGHIGSRQLDEGELRLLGGLLVDVEGDFHGADVALGGHAGDDDLAGADFNVVGVFQLVVLVEGQQGAVHPDGDVGHNFSAGVLEHGLIQPDIGGDQFHEVGCGSLRGQGGDRQCGQNQHQRQGEPERALQKVFLHTQVFLLENVMGGRSNRAKEVLPIPSAS